MDNGSGRGGGVVHGGRGSVSTQPVVRVVGIKVHDTVSIYENSDTMPVTPARAGLTGPAWGNYAGWGQEGAIVGNEWEGGERARACVIGNRPVSLTVTLAIAPTSGVAISGTLGGTATVDGESTILTGRATGAFTFAPNATRTRVTIAFSGNLPHEVGRVTLAIEWTSPATTYRFRDRTTPIRIFLLADDPIRPDYDSANPSDNGSTGRVHGDTVSGTQQRLDKLCAILGRSNRHSVATPQDVNALLWALHRGINDASPPFFDAAHNEHISDDGFTREDALDDAAHSYPVQHNWMMWAQSPVRRGWTRAAGPRAMYWNDASCIGHVQLLKTMAASVGLFARRAWVLPTTTLAPAVGALSEIQGRPDLTWSGTRPVGRNIAVTEGDCHRLGELTSFRQWWIFPGFGSRGAVLARPVLMEPGDYHGQFENFEACLKTANGRFLPGGYPTSSIRTSGATPGADRMGEAFVRDGGFASAIDVLRWWANTGRDGGFVRFMLWCAIDDVPLGNNVVRRDFYYFDRNGIRIERSEFGTARQRNRHLPVPGGDP
ncbi:MAG: hypothetical protein U0414_42940 [Polyangiaceae bacterium]